MSCPFRTAFDGLRSVRHQLHDKDNASMYMGAFRWARWCNMGSSETPPLFLDDGNVLMNFCFFPLKSRPQGHIGSACVCVCCLLLFPALCSLCRILYCSLLDSLIHNSQKKTFLTCVKSFTSSTHNILMIWSTCLLKIFLSSIHKILHQVLHF